MANGYKILEYNIYDKKYAINNTEASECIFCKGYDIEKEHLKEGNYNYFKYQCTKCKSIWVGNLYDNAWEYANTKLNPHYKVICTNAEGKRKIVRESEAGKCPSCHGKYVEGYIKKKGNRQQYMYICSDCGTKWQGNVYDLYWNSINETSQIKNFLKRFF